MTKIEWAEETWSPVAALLKPLKWRKPRHVKLAVDLFRDIVPDEWIDKVFAVMALCPQHTFQVLTKRPDRMREYMTGDRYGIVNEAVEIVSNQRGDVAGLVCRENMDAKGLWPLPNVWLGTSAEDQRAAGCPAQAIRAPAGMDFNDAIQEVA